MLYRQRTCSIVLSIEHAVLSIENVDGIGDPFGATTRLHATRLRRKTSPSGRTNMEKPCSGKRKKTNHPLISSQLLPLGAPATKHKPTRRTIQTNYGNAIAIYKHQQPHKHFKSR